jgi:hypothetical protein
LSTIQHESWSNEVLILHTESEMMRAWKQGVGGYTPMFREEPMTPEDGSPGPSLQNLRFMLRAPLKVQFMFAGPQAQVLVVFTTGETYLATGFGLGHRDLKTKALAQFSHEIGLGSKQDCYDFLSAMPPDYQGVILVPQQGTPIPVQ